MKGQNPQASELIAVSASEIQIPFRLFFFFFRLLYFIFSSLRNSFLFLLFSSPSLPSPLPHSFTFFFFDPHRPHTMAVEYKRILFDIQRREGNKVYLTPPYSFSSTLLFLLSFQVSARQGFKSRAVVARTQTYTVDSQDRITGTASEGAGTE